MSGLTASQQAIFQQAAARWQEIIVGDLPNATYRGLAVDDILINANSATIDIASGVMLDVMGLNSNTLNLGISAAQTLKGTGTLNGTLSEAG